MSQEDYIYNLEATLIFFARMQQTITKEIGYKEVKGTSLEDNKYLDLLYAIPILQGVRTQLAAKELSELVNRNFNQIMPNVGLSELVEEIKKRTNLATIAEHRKTELS